MVCSFRIPWRAHVTTVTAHSGTRTFAKPCTHRVVDEVHGVADVVVHALEGHEQVSVLEAFRDAGREEQRSFSLRIWAGPAGTRTHFVYLLHLVKKSTRQL